MNATRWRGWLPALAVTLLLISYTPAEAQNLALGKPAIDESGRWNGQAQYDGNNITDGVICELDQNEKGTGMSSYWLAPEGQLGHTVTIDLQAPTLITEIHLRNTHNAQFNDRNTFDFQIDAANAITTCSDSSGYRNIVNLVNPVTILQGQLTSYDMVNCPDEIPPDIFDATSGLTTGGQKFQYLRFTALDSYHSSNNTGLNELEVYGTQ